MASNSKPTILALPLEIRHEIYRYAWTLQVDTNKYVGQRFPSWLNKSYVKLQVGQVQKLVSICRQMRDEVLSEYFHRTQVYFRWHRGQLAHHTSIHNNRPRPEFDAPHCIQFSHLLTHYTHVSLQWEPCLCLGNSEGTRSASYALNWLLKLERLKTLELVISKRWVTIMEQLQAKASHRDLNATDLSICSSCFSKLMKLRNLEKVVFKVLSNWFDVISPSRRKTKWRDRNGLRQLRKKSWM
ncbi:hypothetical protein QBC32DRAFT_66357 [Pseudoneurospora amorphoporcata]|uniref:Uncharacterized protein n=1 Tax=Pseudoneurospora amorphoporcata TaxID=241081 RepID=A0AAN6SC17_9PEZI|nr:hypothetical protein QBC32DRAFT_66357 [Pseudoneurospora amorphoporcata]